jgi:hypothetical protein
VRTSQREPATRASASAYRAKLKDRRRSPVKNSAKKSAQLIKGATEIYYLGLSHGLTATHPDLVNRDLLAFCQQGQRKVA